MVRRAELSRPTISRGVAIAFAGLAAVVALAYLGFSLAEQSLDVREWFKPPDLPSFAEPQGAQKSTEYIGPFAGGGTSGNGPDGRIILFTTSRSFDETKLELAASFREHGWEILAMREGVLGARSPDGDLCISYSASGTGRFAAQDDGTQIEVFVYPNCWFTPDCRFVAASVQCLDDPANTPR